MVHLEFTFAVAPCVAEMYPVSLPTWQTEFSGGVPAYPNAFPIFGPVRSVHWELATLGLEVLEIKPVKFPILQAALRAGTGFPVYGTSSI
jgi:hypothetical protein